MTTSKKFAHKGEVTEPLSPKKPNKHAVKMIFCHKIVFEDSLSKMREKITDKKLQIKNKMGKNTDKAKKQKSTDKNLLTISLKVQINSLVKNMKCILQGRWYEEC
jgi:hypothetical protein